MAIKLLLVSNILNRKHVGQIILHKNPTNMHLYMLVQYHYIHTIQSYTFQPSRVHPQGVLIHVVSRVNKMRV